MFGDDDAPLFTLNHEEDDPEPMDFTFDGSVRTGGKRESMERRIVTQLKERLENYFTSNDATELKRYIGVVQTSFEKNSMVLTATAKKAEKKEGYENVSKNYQRTADCLRRALDALDLMLDSIQGKRYDGIDQAMAGFQGAVSDIDQIVSAIST